MCPQCGTRHEDWDHGGDDEEDAYVASVQLCTGCQVIGEKQDEIQKQGGDLHGKKVALIPVAVHAALKLHREMTAEHRRRRDDEDDD